jgi:hypothetical protein
MLPRWRSKATAMAVPHLLGVQPGAIELGLYVHPKLQGIEVRAGGQRHEDRLAMLRRMLADVVNGYA